MMYQSTPTKEASTTEQKKTTTKGENVENDDDNEGGISDLDARVLQSLLDDKELDFKSEESLKKMLENKNHAMTSTDQYPPLLDTFDG